MVRSSSSRAPSVSSKGSRRSSKGSKRSRATSGAHSRGGSSYRTRESSRAHDERARRKPELTTDPKDAKKIRDEMRDKEREKEDQAILSKPLPLNFLIDAIELSVASKFLMRDLTVYIPFVIAYVLIVVGGRGGSEVYWTSKAVRERVAGNEIPGTPEIGPYFDKLFIDSQIPTDIYDWMEGVAIANIWGNNPDKEWVKINYNIGSNQGVGQVRIRHHKVLPRTCRNNKGFYTVGNTTYPELCWAPFSSSFLSREPYGGPPTVNSSRREIWEEPEGNYWHFTECERFAPGITGRLTSYPCGGFMLLIPWNAPLETAIDKIGTLRKFQFLDQWASRLVVLEYFVYNTATDSFTSAKFIYEMVEVGAIVPTIKVRGFTIWSKANTARTVFEFIFFVFVLYYWLKFFIELVQYGKRHDGRYIGYLFGVWNLLELLNLFAFMLTYIFRWVWWSESNKNGIQLPYIDEQYPAVLEVLQSTFYLGIWTNSLNTVITFLKLLKFVRLNPQFNILNRTMEAAGSGIIGVLIIFFLVVFGYGITGISLYGNGIEDYRNLNTSFSSLMRILVGDFDYPALRDENNLVSAFYFWSFTILALFLLLNFLIAVIGEAFSDENAKTLVQPLDAVLYRKMRVLKRKACSTDAWKRLLDVIKRRTKRLPQATVLQYLIEYRTTLAEAAADLSSKSSQDSVSNVDLPDTLITREQLLDIIPLTEYNELGEVFFDTLWDNMVHEYHVQNKEEEKQKEAQEIRLIEQSLRQVLVQLIPPKGQQKLSNPNAPDSDSDSNRSQLTDILTERPPVTTPVSPDGQNTAQSFPSEVQSPATHIGDDDDDMYVEEGGAADTHNNKDEGKKEGGDGGGPTGGVIVALGGEDLGAKVKALEKRTTSMDEYTHNVVRLLCIVENKVDGVSSYTRHETAIQDMPINANEPSMILLEHQFQQQMEDLGDLEDDELSRGVDGGEVASGRESGFSRVDSNITDVLGHSEGLQMLMDLPGTE